MTRLMCSKQRDEVESVKSELFKAGIRSEVRSNPVAAALRVSRFELWVESGGDYLRASKLYAKMQSRSGNEHKGELEEETGETFIDIEELAAEPADPPNRGTGRPVAGNNGEITGGELEQASVLLEKEIETLLERESELSRTCAEQQNKIEELTQSLVESRKKAEKQVADLAAEKGALEREVGERSRSEEQLKREARELQSRLKSGEQALLEKSRKLEATAQHLATQQTAVVELRKEIVAREQELEEAKKMASKACAEATVERQSRGLAEEKAIQAATAAKELERQLAEQKHLEHEVQAYVATMNKLRKKLQATNTGARLVSS